MPYYSHVIQHDAKKIMNEFDALDPPPLHGDRDPEHENVIPCKRYFYAKL